MPLSYGISLTAPERRGPTSCANTSRPTETAAAIATNSKTGRMASMAGSNLDRRASVTTRERLRETTYV
jgi:hypothetical protein